MSRRSTDSQHRQVKLFHPVFISFTVFMSSLSFETGVPALTNPRSISNNHLQSKNSNAGCDDQSTKRGAEMSSGTSRRGGSRCGAGSGGAAARGGGRSGGRGSLCLGGSLERAGNGHGASRLDVSRVSMTPASGSSIAGAMEQYRGGDVASCACHGGG